MPTDRALEAVGRRWRGGQPGWPQRTAAGRGTSTDRMVGRREAGGGGGGGGTSWLAAVCEQGGGSVGDGW
jgi:hypothetical protein